MRNKEKLINSYQKLGLGLFVHYGLYSVLGQGEWIKLKANINDNKYESLINSFSPKQNWAKDLCKFAKKNGFKYVVFTTRHHDGFSLYDTKNLNKFDSKNTIKRDLVKEFVSACREYNLSPFLYHTLIDWREEKKFKSFSDYLVYVRKSIELLCKNYGELGGIWLDGQWKYPNYDWEEKEVFDIITKHQPNAVIINNHGYNKTRKNSIDFFDVCTFERKNISKYNYKKNHSKFAVEMCQTLNSHWGYAENDINYKSINELILNLCLSRKYGGNFLLNIGLTKNGAIRSIDKNIIGLLGKWINLNKKALYDCYPINLKLSKNCFALKNGTDIFIFAMNLPMEIDETAKNYKNKRTIINIPLKYKIKTAKWLDNDQDVNISKTMFHQKFMVPPFQYGTNLITRIAQITIQI